VTIFQNYHLKGWAKLKKTIIFISIFLAIYIVIVILFGLLFPDFLDNALGFVALLGYILTLIPSFWANKTNGPLVSDATTVTLQLSFTRFLVILYQMI
jgi:hypothetical protein